MADLRLEDLWDIIQGIVLFFGGLLVLRILFALWPQIRLIVHAFWMRNFNGNWWSDFLVWLADVKNYDTSDDDIRSYEGGIEPSSDGMEPSKPSPVPPRPDAVHTSIDENRDDRSRQELLDILARQKIDNKYVFSGNKLVELFAGSPHAASRNVILDEVAKIRKGSEPEPTPKAGARLERPSNGWAK